MILWHNFPFFVIYPVSDVCVIAQKLNWGDMPTNACKHMNMYVYLCVCIYAFTHIFGPYWVVVVKVLQKSYSDNYACIHKTSLLFVIEDHDTTADIIGINTDFNQYRDQKWKWEIDFKDENINVLVLHSCISLGYIETRIIQQIFVFQQTFAQQHKVPSPITEHKNKTDFLLLSRKL